MLQYKQKFDTYSWVKYEPNNHEKSLFDRAKKYIAYFRFIPWVEMVAIVNSLSMYATHKDSDIDLFIITEKNRMWFVRVFVTLLFSCLWVWRKGDEVAGNFCLSFFITTDAMDLSKIALEDDIYLYYWIYYLKPIFIRGDMYDQFLAQNSWVVIPPDQKNENAKYITYSQNRGKSCFFWWILDSIFRYFWEKKTQKSYREKWSPEGVIITSEMLKFHDQDRRVEIRDALRIN